MPQITIFSAPKPFTNPHIAIIQRNSIKSWVALGNDVEVFLVGNDEGIKETAAEFGVGHISDVNLNHLGTPYLNSIFSVVREASSSPFLSIVNTDVILTPDLLDALGQVRSQVAKFLLCGKRIDLDITKEINFNNTWLDELRKDAGEAGSLNNTGMDYFLFPRTIYKEIPDFVIGRPAWDNWMLFQARERGWLVVDATKSVLVVHQKHDYSHLPGGKPPYGFEEGNRNIKVAGERFKPYLIVDVKSELVDGRIRKKGMSWRRWLHGLELDLMPKEKRGLRWVLVRWTRWLRRRLGEKV